MSKLVNMKVATNTVVSVRYSLKNAQGETLEDTMSKTPVNYIHGSGNILPALEAALEGLEEGTQQSIVLSPETYPELRDIFYLDVIIDRLREATAEEILLMRPLQKISDAGCEPGCCC